MDAKFTPSPRGRGSHSNASGRFEPHARQPFDDGWLPADPAPPVLRTSITTEVPRTILTRNDSPDIPFDVSINPYRGCEHGCFYCYARPSHAYMGLSPGVDFESRLFAKPNAADLLERELADPAYVPSAIALGTNTDPYQPIERDLKITRSILELLHKTRHPFSIVTKSALVLRDIDLIADMGQANLAHVALSVTTLDRRLARQMEPRASTPERRLEAIGALAAAGVPTAVMIAPVIPSLNDHEIEVILETAAGLGVKQAAYVLLRLPLEIKDLAREWLDTHTPGRAKRVLSLIQSARGGRDYDPAFGKRMTGTGPYADLIRRRFSLAVKRLGLNQRRLSFDLTQFVRPVPTGGQYSLL